LDGEKERQIFVVATNILVGHPNSAGLHFQGGSVANRLKDEIRQNKPFTGLEQEALLNIRRTSGYVEDITQQILKEQGLTDSQYNVLRILRGAGPDGLRCSEIGERMITRDPDITRLLSRLQRRRLVGRHRDTRDRRVIHIRITPAGSAILHELDPIVEASANSLFGHLTRERLALLIDLMEEVRMGRCTREPVTCDGAGHVEGRENPGLNLSV
jgi:DNA-binding MarR family transcriptional regulator